MFVVNSGQVLVPLVAKLKHEISIYYVHSLNMMKTGQEHNSI